MQKAIIILASLLLAISTLSAQTVSDVQVVDRDGNAVNLAEYATDGDPKIISLWATWCGPCRMELNALSKVYDRWKETYGVEIIAVTVDVPSMVSRAEKMFDKNGWTYTFFHDKNKSLLESLGIQGIPYSMLIDGAGNVVSTQSGYFPGYEKDLEAKIKKLKG